MAIFLHDSSLTIGLIIALEALTALLGLRSSKPLKKEGALIIGNSIPIYYFFFEGGVGPYHIRVLKYDIPQKAYSSH